MSRSILYFSLIIDDHGGIKFYFRIKYKKQILIKRTDCLFCLLSSVMKIRIFSNMTHIFRVYLDFCRTPYMIHLTPCFYRIAQGHLLTRITHTQFHILIARFSFAS